MKIRYRIVQERTPDRGWETIGVIAHWLSMPPHLQLNGIVQHTVSTPIWRTISERADEQKLTLETYHLAFVGFDQYYRLLPEIYELEADSAVDIRRIIRERYVWVAQTTPVEPNEEISEALFV